MDPLTFLVLLGLIGLGALFLAALYFAFFIVVLCALLFVMYVGAILYGSIDDYRHNKRVVQGTATYRLPFFYRWAGWRIGHIPEPEFKNGMLFDKKINKFIPIVRVS